MEILKELLLRGGAEDVLGKSCCGATVFAFKDEDATLIGMNDLRFEAFERPIPREVFGELIAIDYDGDNVYLMGKTEDNVLLKVIGWNFRNIVYNTMLRPISSLDVIVGDIYGRAHPVSAMPDSVSIMCSNTKCYTFAKSTQIWETSLIGEVMNVSISPGWEERSILSVGCFLAAILTKAERGLNLLFNSIGSCNVDVNHEVTVTKRGVVSAKISVITQNYETNKFAVSFETTTRRKYVTATSLSRTIRGIKASREKLIEVPSEAIYWTLVPVGYKERVIYVTTDGKLEFIDEFDLDFSPKGALITTSYTTSLCSYTMSFESFRRVYFVALYNEDERKIVLIA